MESRTFSLVVHPRLDFLQNSTLTGNQHQALGTSNTLANSTYHHGRFGNTSPVTYIAAAVKRGHNVFQQYYTEQRELSLSYQCQHFTRTDMERIDLPGIRGRGNLSERLASIDRTGLSEVIQDMSVIPSLLEYFATDLRCLLETLPLLPNVRRFTISDQRWVKDQRRRWTCLPDEAGAFPRDKSFMIQRRRDTGNRLGYDAVILDPRPWPSSQDKLPRGSHLPTWYRGFWILTQVASMLQYEQLKSFTIDADGYRNSSGISHTVLRAIDPIKLQHTVNAFKYLTTLKMEINTHEKDPWTDFPATLANGNIAKMLCAAERLRSLDLAFDSAETQITDLDTLFGKDHIWPQLKALTLTNMCLNGDQWVEFLTRQGGVLQELSMIEISFWDPDNSRRMMFTTIEAMALEYFFIVFSSEGNATEAPCLKTGGVSGRAEIKRIARAIAAGEMSL